MMHLLLALLLTLAPVSAIKTAEEEAVSVDWVNRWAQVSQECQKNRCGPKGRNCKCNEVYPYCNDDSGWCGNTGVHKAKSSGRYNFGVKTAEEEAVSVDWVNRWEQVTRLNPCVHGIVEVSPRPYKGRMSKAKCEQLALKKGTSYVWGNGQLCHVYNVKLDVSKYSPSAGIRDWVTCTPTQGAAVETSEETEVGFIGDANRNLRGECTYGGQRIEGICDIRPGYKNNCNECAFGYTDAIWFNNWCCDKTDAINSKANKCTCPSAAEAAVGKELKCTTDNDCPDALLCKKTGFGNYCAYPQFAGVFEFQHDSRSDTPSLFVYGAAVIGFGIMAYGAGRHFFGKNANGYSTV